VPSAATVIFDEHQAHNGATQVPHFSK
jgi:hypothetical protein